MIKFKNVNARYLHTEVARVGQIKLRTWYNDDGSGGYNASIVLDTKIKNYPSMEEAKQALIRGVEELAKSLNQDLDASASQQKQGDSNE